MQGADRRLAEHAGCDGPVELSVVIPVYRSADSLEALTRRLLTTLDALVRSYEIVFVDDCSPDQSWCILEEIQQEHPETVVAVRLMRNFGQHNALMCGLRHTRGRYVVTMDDDLQNPPEELPKLLASIEQSGMDLVYGSYGAKHHASGRNLGSSIVNAFFRSVFRLRVTVTSYRIIRRELVDAVLSYNLNFTYIDGLLAWNTTRIGDVRVEHHPRAHGRSGYSIGKLLTLASNLFTNFSLAPLQFVSLLGVFAATGGFALGCYYLLCAIFGDIAVPGYASIIVAVLLLGGIQLLSLGIIGEYVGRVHLNINRKPQYTVRTVLAGKCERSDPSGAESPEFDRTPAAFVRGSSGS